MAVRDPEMSLLKVGLAGIASAVRRAVSRPASRHVSFASGIEDDNPVSKSLHAERVLDVDDVVRRQQYIRSLYPRDHSLGWWRLGSIASGDVDRDLENRLRTLSFWSPSAAGRESRYFPSLREWVFGYGMSTIPEYNIRIFKGRGGDSLEKAIQDFGSSIEQGKYYNPIIRRSLPFELAYYDYIQNGLRREEAERPINRILRMAPDVQTMQNWKDGLIGMIRRIMSGDGEIAQMEELGREAAKRREELAAKGFTGEVERSLGSWAMRDSDVIGLGKYIQDRMNRFPYRTPISPASFASGAPIVLMTDYSRPEIAGHPATMPQKAPVAVKLEGEKTVIAKPPPIPFEASRAPSLMENSVPVPGRAQAPPVARRDKRAAAQFEDIGSSHGSASLSSGSFDNTDLSGFVVRDGEQSGGASGSASYAPPSSTTGGSSSSSYETINVPNQLDEYMERRKNWSHQTYDSFLDLGYAALDSLLPHNRIRSAVVTVEPEDALGGDSALPPEARIEEAGPIDAVGGTYSALPEDARPEQVVPEDAVEGGDSALPPEARDNPEPPQPDVSNIEAPREPVAGGIPVSGSPSLLQVAPGTNPSRGQALIISNGDSVEVLPADVSAAASRSVQAAYDRIPKRVLDKAGPVSESQRRAFEEAASQSFAVLGGVAKSRGTVVSAALPAGTLYAPGPDGPTKVPADRLSRGVGGSMKVDETGSLHVLPPDNRQFDWDVEQGKQFRDNGWDEKWWPTGLKESLEKVAKNLPNDPEGHQSLGAAMVEEGNRQHEKGDFEKAKSLWEQAKVRLDYEGGIRFHPSAIPDATKAGARARLAVQGKPGVTFDVFEDKGSAGYLRTLVGGRKVIDLQAKGPLTESDFNILRQTFLNKGISLMSTDVYKRLTGDRSMKAPFLRMGIEELRMLANDPTPVQPEEDFSNAASRAYEYRQGYLGAVSTNLKQRALFQSSVNRLNTFNNQLKVLRSYEDELRDAMQEYDALKGANIEGGAVDEYRQRVLNATERIGRRVNLMFGGTREQNDALSEDITSARKTPEQLQVVYKRVLGDVQQDIEELKVKIATLQGDLKQMAPQFAASEALTDEKLQGLAAALEVPYKAPSAVAELTDHYKVPDFVQMSESALSEPTKKERQKFLRDSMTSMVLREFNESLKSLREELGAQKKLTESLTARLNEPPTKRAERMFEPVPVYQPMQRLYHRFQEYPFGPTYGYPRGRDYTGMIPVDTEGLERRYLKTKRTGSLRSRAQSARGGFRRGIPVRRK